ncbi:unnamed protein product, partial [Iphiclides podalirius]
MSVFGFDECFPANNCPSCRMGGSCKGSGRGEEAGWGGVGFDVTSLVVGGCNPNQLTVMLAPPSSTDD